MPWVITRRSFFLFISFFTTVHAVNARTHDDAAAQLYFELDASIAKPHEDARLVVLRNIPLIPRSWNTLARVFICTRALSNSVRRSFRRVAQMRDASKRFPRQESHCQGRLGRTMAIVPVLILRRDGVSRVIFNRASLVSPQPGVYESTAVNRWNLSSTSKRIKFSPREDVTAGECCSLHKFNSCTDGISSPHLLMPSPHSWESAALFEFARHFPRARLFLHLSFNFAGDAKLEQGHGRGIWMRSHLMRASSSSPPISRHPENVKADAPRGADSRSRRGRWP